jgi:MarR family 2-MHQ and catechol resistance regulon transcriptional repressor
MSRDLKTLTILMRTHDTLTSKIKEDVQNYGFNVTEFGVMEALYHKGNLSVQQIVDKILIPNSGMSYVLSTLKKKDYIKQVQCEVDKRKYYISLTKKGKDIFECMYEAHLKTLRGQLDVMSVQEKKHYKHY